MMHKIHLLRDLKMFGNLAAQNKTQLYDGLYLPVVNFLALIVSLMLKKF